KWPHLRPLIVHMRPGPIANLALTPLTPLAPTAHAPTPEAPATALAATAQPLPAPPLPALTLPRLALEAPPLHRANRRGRLARRPLRRCRRELVIGILPRQRHLRRHQPTQRRPVGGLVHLGLIVPQSRRHRLRIREAIVAPSFERGQNDPL